MIKLVYVAAFVFVIIGSTFSQADSSDIGMNNTPKDSVSNKNLKKRQDMLFIDLTWDYLIGMPSTVTQKWYGRGINAGLMYDQPLNNNNTVSLGIGAAIQSHNYYTDAVIIRDSANISRFFVPGPTTKSRGKLVVNYVDVPFELRFRTKPNSKDLRWKFAFGGKFGYRINVYEKIIDDEDIKIKYYDYPNIAQWRYGVTTRIGYGAVMFSGFYSLSTLFTPNNSDGNINALSLGISIVPF